MSYVPPLYLLQRFHLVPDADDRRDPRFKAGLVLIWDPRPIGYERSGQVWAVAKTDPRYVGGARPCQHA